MHVLRAHAFQNLSRYMTDVAMIQTLYLVAF